VVDALQCAVAIQQGMQASNAAAPDSERIEFRIGINVGDIVVEEGDVYGDGVNVAARLEGLAEPGGICVSGRVQEDVRGKTAIAFEDAGEQRLKNIDWPVRVYRVRVADSGDSRTAPLSLPDKPSIAVLPFTNMSGDPEQEYFADGMVEEIITALSRMRWLFVIARNSSFTYKGKAVDVKQVGRELGVRYVLEGSVRRAGNRVRITGQLIDATTGNHIWADRFDGALEDVFELQDQVTGSVVGAIAPKMEQAEIERARRKPTGSLDAYDYYLRGLEKLHQWTRDSLTEALALFYRAIELDPEFATAYGMAARCYSARKSSGWVEDRVHEIAEARRLGNKVIELGQDDPVALCTGGIALGWVADELEKGADLIERSLRLDPNYAWGWLFSGWTNVWMGNHEKAIEDVGRAMRLSPNDPHSFNMKAALALSHFFAGRHDESVTCAMSSIRSKPDNAIAVCIYAAASALLGHMSEAESAMARVRELQPALSLSNLADWFTIRRPEDLERWTEGLQKAGLPA